MTDEPALTMKEAVKEIRADVKEMLGLLGNKADRAEFNLLVIRVERLETEAARAAEVKILEDKVSALSTRQAGEDAVSQFKKVILGTAVTAILALLGLIGSIALHFLPSSSHH